MHTKHGQKDLRLRKVWAGIAKYEVRARPTTYSHDDPCVDWEYELAVRDEDGKRSGLPLSASLASEAADLHGHASAWSVGPVLSVIALQ